MMLMRRAPIVGLFKFLREGMRDENSVVKMQWKTERSPMAVTLDSRGSSLEMRLT